MSRETNEFNLTVEASVWALHVVIHRELVRMRAKSQRVVFFLFHLDPVGDEVGVEDVAAEQELVIGLERFDRAAE